MPRTYDTYGGADQVLYLGRVGTWDGTIAAAANLLVFKVPANVNGEITGASVTVGTGGTVAAAAQKFTVSRSLAGTGTYTGLGTSALVGTLADQSVATISCTGGTFIAGDYIAIREVAGTAALGLGNLDFWIEWKDRAV